jgi:acyl-CoA reductase-like NAD-dependent aldehyde dehydrogenase
METVTDAPNLESFLERARRLFIGGEWSEATSSEELVSIDPGTGEVLGIVAEANASDVDVAVQAAAAAFPGWRDTRASERGEILWRFADTVEEHAHELALLESLDSGKPLTISEGFIVPMVASTLRYFAGLAGKLEGRAVTPAMAQRGHHQVVVTRVPVGVVAAIVPWNMPAMLAAWKLAPALAFGNTVVLKPAEETPLVALRLAELGSEAGLPPGALNVVTGSGATTGASLASHPDIHKVSFTGSTEVGREILSTSASDFKRVSLELGGKSAVIVFADALARDLKWLSTQAAWATFSNAGQICAAGSRLLIQEDAYESVLEGVATVAENIKPLHALEEKARMGPMISEEHLARVQGFIEKARADSTLVSGGSRASDTGFFLQPTIFSDVSSSNVIWQEEIFGPVIAARSFSDIDEAAALANDTKYGLAAGIFTQNLGAAQQLSQRLRAGTIWINTYNLIDPAVSWGGFGESGIGRENGWSAVDLYTEEKTVWMSLD